VESYKLNKLLYESRSRTSLRYRLLENPSAVAREYLSAEDTEAVITVCRMPYRESDRPAKDAEPLVERGAHPLGALMAVHVLQAEQRRLAGSSPRSRKSQSFVLNRKDPTAVPQPGFFCAAIM
jgi:hypothetical protein